MKIGVLLGYMEIQKNALLGGRLENAENGCRNGGNLAKMGVKNDQKTTKNTKWDI